MSRFAFLKRLLARFQPKPIIPAQPASFAPPPYAEPEPEPLIPPQPTQAAPIPHREGRVQCASPAGLHHMAYVEWGAPDNPKVLICVHGLTRTARDFDFIAAALAQDYRVVCPDVVGRGKSDWLRDKSLYAIPQYVSDMVTLIARLDVEQVDWIGTSMGGLIGMTLAAQDGSPIRRMVLNDVGPLLAATALQRIATYVGRRFEFASMAEAEAHLRKAHAPFGLLTDEQWQHITRWSVKPNDSGAFVFHYDLGIGDVFRNTPMLMDVNLWPIYDRIRCPVLTLRGTESDLLSHKTLVEMSERGPRSQILEVPEVGHAPTLMTEAQIAPIREFLTG